MARFIKTAVRVGGALILLLATGLLTRKYWLPERFAVNVPISSLVGRPRAVPPLAVVASLSLPAGFTLTAFASGRTNARSLRVTQAGDVVVSQPREDRVTLLLKDGNGDGVSDGSSTLLSGLDRPHGLALRDRYLYVAEMTAVGRIVFDTAGKTSGVFERVITGLPSGGNHWTRTIGFGPDGLLYVSVGSSCNVCIERVE